MFNKIMFISVLATSIFASSAFAAPSSEKLVLQCSFGSREIEIPDRRTDTGFETGWHAYMAVDVNPTASRGEAYSPNQAKYDRAEFGIYSVELNSIGSQGQLHIVDTSTKKEVFSILWQNLKMLKDIEIPGNHGFTGLLGLNPYGDSNEGKKPELQFSCRVRASQK